MILGLLDPEPFLGGDMPLDASLADAATKTGLMSSHLA